MRLYSLRSRYTSFSSDLKCSKYSWNNSELTRVFSEINQHKPLGDQVLVCAHCALWATRLCTPQYSLKIPLWPFLCLLHWDGDVVALFFSPFFAYLPIKHLFSSCKLAVSDGFCHGSVCGSPNGGSRFSCLPFSYNVALCPSSPGSRFHQHSIRRLCGYLSGAGE